MPEAFMFLICILVVLTVIIIIVATYRTYYGNRAFRFGYASRAEYFKAVPRTEDEKRDAVDQACKGTVICLLALVFPPLLLVGLFPLFFGARKTIYVCMGLGLNDETDPPQA
jgi:hypothetical protein